jgi:hypothetical protein
MMFGSIITPMVIDMNEARLNTVVPLLAFPRVAVDEFHRGRQAPIAAH